MPGRLRLGSFSIWISRLAARSRLFLRSVKSEAIEEALQELLGPFAGPQGLVITLRRHDEYQVLIERIQALDEELERKGRELSRMASYPVMCLEVMDELRVAVRKLQALDQDVSWVRSIKVQRGNARA